jgi:uncharacterized protein YndB with AHSA1/START domain
MQEITIETVFDAPAERVWQAWTDPARMTWFGSDPKGRVLHAAADARLGGTFSVAFRNSDETEFVCQGIYKEVFPNRKLAFTWEWENEPGTISFITIFLEPLKDGRTQMTFTHGNLWEGSAHNYLEGWRSTFEKLNKSLTGESNKNRS